MSKSSAKGGGDFLKTYVLVMTFIAAVLGVLWFKLNGERAEYDEALAGAPRMLGTAEMLSSGRETERPTTIAAYGVAVLQYLETFHTAASKGEIVDIPIAKIQMKVDGMQLKITSVGQQTELPVRQKGYTETSLTFNLENCDEERFAKLLYNLELVDPKLHVLSFSWQMRAAATENPYPPGNAIQGPQFAMGYRKPIAR
jgi:hypothetical protein